MSFTAIFNCDLFTPDQCVAQGLVLIEGNQIRAVGHSHEIPLPADTRLLDAQGGRVTTGLIDLGGVRSNDNQVEAQGITNYLVRVAAQVAAQVAVQDERDLQMISHAAACLPSPAGKARALGLHLVEPWQGGDDISPHWQDLWLASDATIKLITLTDAISVNDMALMLDAGIRLALPVTSPTALPTESGGESDAGSFLDNSRMALWGISENVLMEPARYHLVTLDHVRSTNPSVLRALLSSHRLILAGSDAEPLSTRAIRQLMASADTDFATALTAATLAPANFLDSPLGRLAGGVPADLICWTRHGNLAWTMVNGEIVYP